MKLYPLMAAVMTLAVMPHVSFAGPSLDPTFGLPLPSPSHTAKADAQSADWIWASSTADHQTIYLRRAFTLSHLPKNPIISITADDFFTLYVNGKEVDRSVPGAPGADVWEQVHQDDLAPYLHAGANVLAIEGQNALGAAGVVASLDLPGQSPLVTNASWKVDSAQSEPVGWTNTDFSDTSWDAATVEAPVQGGVWGENGVLQGWPGIEELTAPYLAHLTLPVETVMDLDPEGGKFAGAAGLAGHRDAVLTVTPPAAGPSGAPASLVLDFGKEVAGRIHITPLTSGSIQAGTGESLGEAVNSPWGGWHAFVLEPHIPAYTPSSAFRYVDLKFPPTSNPAPVRIKVTLDDIYYPVTYQGSFDCSDPLLTKIWYTGAYTAHLCMQQYIWDAPKRDRNLWCGDLDVSGDVIDDVFADKFLMEQTLQKLRDNAQGDHPDTALPAAEVNGIPGYSAAWFCTLADFYRHVGDQAYLEKQHALILSLLAYEQKNFNASGIFDNANGGWCYTDWSPGFDNATPQSFAATDFFLIRGIHEAVFMLNALGDTANAAKYAAFDQTLTAAAQNNYFDSTSNSYGQRLQENAMAIYSRVATPVQAATIAQNILNPSSDAWDKTGVPPYNNGVISPYYGNYVLRALSRGDDTEDGLQLLRSYWGGMIAEGATTFWEAYDPMWPKVHPHINLYADGNHGYYVSLCHGWSSGPTSWLTERVLGVRPTSGGFATAVIEPELGDLQWAKGAVPTPHGLIRVTAEKTPSGMSCQVEVPAGVRAFIELPGKSVWMDHAGTEDLTSLPSAALGTDQKD